MNNVTNIFTLIILFALIGIFVYCIVKDVPSQKTPVKPDEIELPVLT